MDEAAPQAAGSDWTASARAEAIEALKFGWGDAYDFGEDAEDGWWAMRRDGLGGRITAADPGELHTLVAADYAVNPVPREFDPGEA